MNTAVSRGTDVKRTNNDKFPKVAPEYDVIRPPESESEHCLVMASADLGKFRIQQWTPLPARSQKVGVWILEDADPADWHHMSAYRHISTMVPPNLVILGSINPEWSLYLNSGPSKVKLLSSLYIILCTGGINQRAFLQVIRIVIIIRTIVEMSKNKDIIMW
jgi:hypothetical protein